MRKAVRELFKNLLADLYIYLLTALSVFMAPFVEQYKAGIPINFGLDYGNMAIVGFIALMMMYIAEQQGDKEGKLSRAAIARRAAAAIYSGFFWHTLI